MLRSVSTLHVKVVQYIELLLVRSTNWPNEEEEEEEGNCLLSEGTQPFRFE